MAVAGEAGGITVSTLAEAEYFAERGFRDITIAAGTTPQKLDRVEALANSGVSLNVITDDKDTALEIARRRAPFKALIEIDSGEARGGVDPFGEELLEIGRALGDKLAGVLTHAGHSYECRSVDGIRRVAEQERNAVVTAARRLRDAGLVCDVVSVGSTPTMAHVERMDGVTEARPGVYMFGDLFQAAIQSCTREDIAVTVLASGYRAEAEPQSNAARRGCLALSKDRSTGEHKSGRRLRPVLDIDGRPAFGECIIEHAYQEHGVAVGEKDRQLPFTSLKVGTKLRVAPNHSCITAAAHDRYYIVDGTREVIAEWDSINGW